MSDNEEYSKEFFDNLRDQIDEWEGWAEEHGVVDIATGVQSVKNILLIAAPHMYENELDMMYKLAKPKTKKHTSDIFGYDDDGNPMYEPTTIQF